MQLQKNDEKQVQQIESIEIKHLDTNFNVHVDLPFFIGTRKTKKILRMKGMLIVLKKGSWLRENTYWSLLRWAWVARITKF